MLLAERGPCLEEPLRAGVGRAHSSGARGALVSRASIGRGTMRFVRCLELDCLPSDAIRHARTTRMFEYVAAPWLRFEPLDPPALPDEWSPGRYLVRMKLFGRVALGTQWIRIRAVEQRGDRLLIHDEGTSERIPVWDHRIEIAPGADGRTRYCDRVAVEAGWHTPFVAWFAKRFFAHRQRRWRRLVAAKFDFDA